eukprot:4753005-Pleurochrysis_carterae.AAC.1
MDSHNSLPSSCGLRLQRVGRRLELSFTVSAEPLSWPPSHEAQELVPGVGLVDWGAWHWRHRGVRVSTLRALCEHAPLLARQAAQLAEAVRVLNTARGRVLHTARSLVLNTAPAGGARCDEIRISRPRPRRVDRRRV